MPHASVLSLMVLQVLRFFQHRTVEHRKLSLDYAEKVKNADADKSLLTAHRFRIR